MRHFTLVSLLSACALASLPGQKPAATSTAVQDHPVAVTELAGVRAAVDRVAKVLSLDGAGLSVVRSSHELHRSLHREFTADQVVPIAAASKWLAVATIMSLVDDGTLDLDTPVARYVEEFDRDDRRRVTLRQCLSCISGLPVRMPDHMRNWDMDKFAEEAADEAMRAYPGTSFSYGGIGFQVVALAAVRATGEDWHQLFATRVANRLGMRNTQFGTLFPVAAQAGKTALPWVPGGAVSTLSDYTRFVQMLLGEGMWHGNRVLAAASVKEMLKNQVPKRIDVKASKAATSDLAYGLGTWIETTKDGVVRLSDPGALGFTPWIDPDLRIGGVFAVKERGSKVPRNLARVQKVVRSAVMSPAVAGTSDKVKMRHDGRNREFQLYVPPYAESQVGLPLMIVLHDAGCNGEQVRQATELDKFGVDEGFVVAFPDAKGSQARSRLTWNSGSQGVRSSRNKTDDVGFLRGVVAKIQGMVPIDANRIFVVGHGNGGMMCHRLAREASDVFTGIAVVAGSMNYTVSNGSSPIATMLVHGSKDDYVLIGGGIPAQGDKRRVDGSLASAADYYVTRNGLVDRPFTAVGAGVSVARYTLGKFSAIRPPVWVVTLQGGGHAWPGQEGPSQLVRDRRHAWSATRGIVRFFAMLDADLFVWSQMPAVPR